MQMLQTQINAEPILATHSMEQNMEELQDTIARYRPLFYRRAYRYLGNAYDAEDAVQDALLSAYKHLHQFKGNARMTTWLTSIVTNSALTLLRRRPRHPHCSMDERLTPDQNVSVADRLVDARPSPEEECATAEIHGYLMHSIDTLSPLLRTAIQLRDFEGLTTTEAAEFLGVPESTLKTRVSRARAAVKRHVQRGRKRTSMIARMQPLDALQATTIQPPDAGFAGFGA